MGANTDKQATWTNWRREHPEANLTVRHVDEDGISLNVEWPDGTVSYLRATYESGAALAFEDLVSVGDLVTVQQIAEKAVVDWRTVHQWKRRHDFPSPLAGNVYHWPSVEAWLKLTGRL